MHIPPSLFHRKFLLLWLGMMISIAGSQMQLTALFWQIRTLTDQPIALGVVGLVRILPVIFFSLVGGAVADVFNRRVVMFITQSIMALSAGVLFYLTKDGSIQLWQIYLLTAIQAVAVAFDSPSRQALVPNLVPVKDLPNAFSMNSIAMQTGSILGPALSGLVIAFKGLEYAYLFNMISYGAVLLALILMGRIQQQSSPIPGDQKRRQGISLEAIREGVQFILSQPIILSTMVIDFFATFFSSANTLMPIVAVDVLGVGEVEYGFLSSAQSVGALLAALWLSQMELIHHQGKTFLRAVFFFGLATVVFGLSRSYWLSLMALMAIGASDSVSTVIRNTIRQLQTPDYIRGRMTSINQIFFMGGPQLGELEAGIVAQAFGAPIAIITGGIGCILALYATIRRWPHLQQYDGSKPEALATPAD